MSNCKTIFVVVILFILNSTITIYGIDFCSEPPNESGSVQLRFDLLCKYDKSISPGSKQNQPITVNIKFFLKYFTYDMYEFTLSVHSWILMHWDDERLKWNPKDYQSISTVFVHTDEIWTPELSELRRVDLSEDIKGFNSKCLAQSTGTVICVIPAGHNALCAAELHYYPFDVQECQVVYGTWNNLANPVDFKIKSKTDGVNLEDLTPNPEWNLLSIEAIKYLNSTNGSTIVKPLLKINYVIQRQYTIFVATIVIPALILVTLVLTTTFMDFQNPDRLRIGCFNLLCHFMYVQHIFWQLPPNVVKTPLIVTFFRDSMVLCSTHLVLTVIYSKIIGVKSQCPNYIVNLVQKIKTNPLGRFFINPGYSKELMSSTNATEDEEKDTLAENTPTNTWLLVITLFDNATIVLYFLTYMGLFIGCVLF